jgi:inosine/xanthosine triphosphatase
MKITLRGHFICLLFPVLVRGEVKMKIIIGSKNPAKNQAVKNAFDNSDFEFVSMDIPSGVNEQPFSDEETINGAINRAVNALKLGEGEIGIGLEGGVQETSHGLLLCNWGALASKDFEPIIAGGARLLLPEEIAQRLRAGEELGPVMDDYAKMKNVRKHEGAIGIFTDGVINRVEMFTHIMNLLVGQYHYRKKQNL